MELLTPTSSKPLSVMPGSRVFKSPLTDEQIWKLLCNAGFNEESIKHKDKAALIAYIAKLEAESIVQPPEQNRQLARIMDMLLPVYRLGLRDSKVINNDSLFLCVLMMFFTMSMK